MGKKLTYKFVKEQIEKEGYKLLSTEYVHSQIKLKMKCPQRHNFEMIYNSFQQGQRCPVCRYINTSKRQKLDYSFIKKQIENERGYKLLSKKYIGANSKIRVECDKGHKYEVKYGDFQQGRRCPICNGRNNKPSYEFVKKYIENEGYKLLSKKYIDSRSKLKIICPNNHIRFMSWVNFRQGNRCPKCSTNMISKREKEIYEYITGLNINIIENDRTQIKNPLTGRPLELDIFIPELNKAIEFNGRYWHKQNDAKKRDKIKREQCKKIGIDLLVIEEQDWIDNEDLCYCDINNFLLS